MPILASNKRANFDYKILETLGAGLVLTGAEVKSIRAGQIHLKDAFITIKDSEMYLTNAHIASYPQAYKNNPIDPTRPRKLLLKKSEISRLIGLKSRQGLTIIPLKVYTKQHLIKLEIGVGQGRKKVDKREMLKKRDIEKEMRKFKM